MDLTIPITKELLAELRFSQRALGAVGGPLFPSAKDPRQAMRSEMLDQWLRAVEKTLGLAKLGGGLWHPYRRKWDRADAFAAP